MLDLPAAIAALPPLAQERVIRAMPEALLRDWAAAFPAWAHDGQRAPAGDWRTWVIMGGRGFGKTRAGAEWVLERARGEGEASAGRHASKSRDVGQARLRRPAGRPTPSPALACATAGRAGGLRLALVGATIDEARAVMVEGPSGLLALAREGEIARWAPSERRLVFSNGAEAALFSGRSPQALRGPEHDFAWCDELGKWAKAGEAWDMLQLGLRRGANPQAVVTTTPSADPALARVMAEKRVVTTGGRTHLNRHLPAAFIEAVEAAYAGTRLGAQEIEGLLPGEREGSLWPRGLIEGCRWGDGTGAKCAGPSTIGQGVDGPPPRDKLGEDFGRIVVGVDPPASAAGTCGIVVAGLAADGRAWVLADASVEGLSPEGWARAAARAADEWGADRVVAEANQGGDMVKSVLLAARATLSIELVKASRGKWTRAEPVAALFENGRAGFAGRFPALEAELAGFTAGGWTGEGSPDRADAMVWALWALCLKGRGEPRVRFA